MSDAVRLRRLISLRGPTLVGFLVAFAVVWLAANLASSASASGTGVSPWYVGGALDVVLFAALGWRWWPLPVLLGLARALIVPSGLAAPLELNLIAATLEALILALAVRTLTRILRVHFPLYSLRDVWLFALVLGLIAPALSAGAAIGVMVAGGVFTGAGFWEQFGRFVASDTAAIVTIVPAVTQLLAVRGAAQRRREGERAKAGLLTGLSVTVAVVVAEYLIATRFGSPILELSFVPLAWLAIRYGIEGAVYSVVLASLAASAMQWQLHVPIDSQIEYQAYLVASAMMALLLGSITSDRDVLLAHLERSAYVDALTGLPNRERLVAWIRRRRGDAVVLAMLDIDDMRLYNEGIGRRAADRIVQEFATRLRAGFAADYLVARVSSDEFAVAVASDRAGETLIAEIHALLEEPFEVDGARIFVQAAVGAVRLERVAGPDDLMRRADLALHHAKEAPTRAVVYAPEMAGSSVPLLVGELHRAVEQGELVPFYQPIFRYDRDAQRWVLAGGEALLRWLHPHRGVLAPDEFIELLERLSIGDRVGWAVIEESLRHAARWRARVPEFRVWVNLFSRQALDPHCAARIERAIAAAELAPQALVVEINERTVVSDEREIIRLVQDLRDCAVTTAIDDFGAGGSSLGRVRDVPAHVLKIDRTFVTRSEIDAKAKAVAAAIVRLAGELGMAVVAEGVENAAQIETMLDVGCELAQGYALGHPVPAAHFDALIAAVPASQAIR